MNNIYLDNAATTKVRKEVIDSMIPFFSENYGNASSIYEIGRDAKKAIDEAREVVAKIIGAETNEIFFTGCGTESDNWALRGVSASLKDRGNHIITTSIEHHAILHTCEDLEKNGFEVTYLPVDEFGIINLNDLKKAIRPTTILISIMFANNEIGTIQPVKEIGEIAKANNIYFHTDAVQAVGHIKIDVKDLNIDLLSLSGHKFYGPKGVGVLFIRSGVKIKPLITGGAQEHKRRAGTENISGIVGLAKAIELANLEMDYENKRITIMRDQLIDGILKNIPYSRLNGSRDKRLANNVNISFEFIEGESLLLLLDMQKIFASSGSACTSGSLEPSHVLLAIGLPHEKAHGSLRLTLGRFNTTSDVNKVLEALPPIVKRLRDMSPLYEDHLKKQNL